MPSKASWLPAAVHSPDQLTLCAEELHALAASLRRAQVQKEAGVRSSRVDDEWLSRETSELLAALPAEKRADPAELDGLAVKLEEAEAKNPRLSMTLAGLAGHTLREELTEWMRANLHPDLLVTFHVNPDIAGGSVVRTPKKLYDWSWRTRLLEQPSKLAEILSHV